MNRIEAKRRRRSLLEAAVTTIVLTCAVPCAWAQTSTWKGGTGNWNAAGNWTPAGVPNNSTTAVDITGSSGNLSSVTLNNLSPQIQNLSLDSYSTLTIDGNAYLYVAGPAITNAGQISVGNSSSAGNVVLNGSSVNLSGAGTLSLNNAGSIVYGITGGNTLVNQSTIQGQGYIEGNVIGTPGLNITNPGTINANVSGGTLTIDTPITNTGTLEATGGGTLRLGQGGEATITNTGGTIYAGSSSSVSIFEETIIGGNLTTASGGQIAALNYAYLQGVTITQGSNYLDTSVTLLTSNLVNQGTVAIATGGVAVTQLIIDASTVTLSGGGTVNLNSTESMVMGNTLSTYSLVNMDNTIQGQGFISALASFVNDGTVIANVSGGTLSIGYFGAAPTTNNGTFQVMQGSTLQFSNTSFTNAGMVNIGALADTSSSLVQMVGSINYVQTSGTTTLWSAYSTLSVYPGQSVNIEGGLLQGFGTVSGNLVNSGTVQPGDGPGVLTVQGNYTQNPGGSLDILIGGLTSGSGYSVLSVQGVVGYSGLASLSGALEVSLLNGFNPAVGNTFVILTSDGLSGMFTDNTIQVGNVTFDVEYSPAGYLNDVVLDVVQVSSASVPEPASLLMFAIGLTGAAVYVARRRVRTARARTF